MTYKPVVPLSVYLSEKCKSESIIVENQIFVLCSSQQLIGNLKLPRAYRRRHGRGRLGQSGRKKHIIWCVTYRQMGISSVKKREILFPAPAGETCSTGATLT